jgi:hypothetical protein
MRRMARIETRKSGRLSGPAKNLDTPQTALGKSAPRQPPTRHKAWQAVLRAAATPVSL